MIEKALKISGLALVIWIVSLVLPIFALVLVAVERSDLAIDFFISTYALLLVVFLANSQRVSEMTKILWQELWLQKPED